MIRILLAGSLLIATITAAHAFGFGLGNRYGKLGVASGAGVAAPALQGSLVLEDGTSFLLLEDGASHLCFEGGC